MADQEVEVPEVAEPVKQTPFEFLQTFPGAPSQTDIDQLKLQAPGNRIRLFHSSDGKRIYLVRGIGGSELETIQNGLPAGIAPEKLAVALQNAVVIRCTVWTSATIDHRLNDLSLKGSPAGLPTTINEIVSQLSDYMDPVDIQRFSADL